MVTFDQTAQDTVILAKPNHSASWHHNLWVVAAIAVPSLTAGIVFAILGAWPILPLIGIELVALGLALYIVNWRLEYRHVIRVNGVRVQVDKGYFAPKWSWHFDRADAAIRVTPETNPWQGPRLSVHDRHNEIPVGGFLNREDSLQLLSLLRQQLTVRTHSPERQVEL